MRSTRRINYACLALAVIGAATACGSGERSTTRTVLVDFAHDEFVSGFARNFPTRVEAYAGDEILFRQAWTGEPHTVTGGTLADDVGRAMQPLLPTARAGKAYAQEPPKALSEAIERIGEAFVGPDFDQTAGQPCYLQTGEPPTGDQPCPETAQPEFDGRLALHSSGIIRYDGPGGNEHRVRLSDDISSGTYFFYCLVHGPSHFVEVVIRDRGTDIPSPAELVRETRADIERHADPLLNVYRDASRGGKFVVDGDEVDGPFAGLYTPDVFLASVNEFVPAHRVVAAGEPVTWKVFGGHTISFNVPRYFPLMDFSGGEVHVNPQVRKAAGGAPALPAAGRDVTQDSATDGGSWDGKGFWSSGEVYAEPYAEYAMRITEPGTYRYACLIHPAMVGKLTVTD